MKHLLWSTLLVPVLAFTALGESKQITFEKDNAVWLSTLDSTAQKNIAHGQAPDLSPDGTQLAFNTVQPIGQPAARKIAIADLATGNITIFKDVPSENCLQPRWSPDGKQLVFYFYVNNEMRIGTIHADGTGFRYVQETESPHHNYWAVTWAADGQSFFAEDMESLYHLDLDAKVLKKWTIEKLIPHGGMSGDVRLDASPDGKTLLMDVEMAEKERENWDGPPPAIWTLDLATEKVTRLTPKKLYAWDSHWLAAPDSILFCSQAPDETDPSIYSMSITGQGKDRKLLIKNARTPGAAR